jgi:hypothetical protein
MSLTFIQIAIPWREVNMATRCGRTPPAKRSKSDDFRMLQMGYIKMYQTGTNRHQITSHNDGAPCATV